MTQGIAARIGAGSFASPTATIGWGPGTGIVVDQLSGVSDTPGVRTSTASKAFGHGGHKGKHFVNIRTISMSLLLQAPDGNPLTLYDLYRQAEQALAPQVDNEFPLLLFDSTRLINCRPTRRAGNYDAQIPSGAQYGHIDVEFEASDPRVYNATQQTATLGLVSSASGLSWPLHWPLAWGASSGGPVNCVNNGNFDSLPIVTINGPLTNPSLERISPAPDQVVTFNIVLGNTDTLVVDFLNTTVTLNGTTSRYNTIDPASKWWSLLPGTNSIRLNANSGTGNAIVAYRDAWV